MLQRPIEQIIENYPTGSVGIKKFVMPQSVRDEAMRDLYRANITEATLFPGIDGMARSLAFDLEYHWAYDPKTMERYPGFEKPPYGLPDGTSDPK